MNDFLEVRYGIHLVQAALRTTNDGKRLFALVNRIRSGMSDEIISRISSLSAHQELLTYVSCFSEHDENQIDLGLLSMWRAYGGDESTMIVIERDAVLQDSNISEFIVSPVLYASDEEFQFHFAEWVNKISDNENYLRQMDASAVEENIISALHFAALSVKHPGFHEEREWRLIYSPSLSPATHGPNKIIESDISVVNGSPQIIYKIPLALHEDSGIDLSVSRLFKQIVVGPVRYPQIVRDALTKALSAEIPDSAYRVKNSQIPLRR